MEAVSPESFDLVCSADAEALLTSWMEQFGPVNAREVEGDLDEVYSLLRSASAVLELRDLGEDARHEWGWVVGLSGFHEFVIVEPEGGVALIVATDD